MSYHDPLSTRYASPEIVEIFSQENRIRHFRRLWVALAKAEKALGVPISPQQIEEMERSVEKIDLNQIQGFEKRFRHEVMAHIHAFGALCPSAKRIIHLGATSCFVTDNSDLLQMKEGLTLLLHKCVLCLRRLARLAEEQANHPCLGLTHFQPAQPTTIGKRISLWLQDFFLDAIEWERLLRWIPFLGAKGATGTQSAFLVLFDGKAKKVEELEQRIAAEMGFSEVISLSGQTYTRKIDVILLNALASFAASAHKMATDLRLLAHEGEILESFEKEQVGSSAMPYKRNPILSERICGLSRFVLTVAQNPPHTLATQWLERSLDDSSNRRLAIPAAFLAVDAILNLLLHLAEHMQPIPQVALKKVEEMLPMLATENLLMAAVKKGGDRQMLHEQIRLLTQEKPMKEWLLAIEQNACFQLTKREIESLSTMQALVGRAPEQVTEFLSRELNPLLDRWNFPVPSVPAIEV